MPVPFEPAVDSPRQLSEAYRLLADGAPRPIAGGTDLMVQITGELGEPPERVLDIWHLDELRGIRVEGDALVLGALTTYTEIRRSPLVAEFLPALAEAAATIGAAQIQNRGTLGGNVVNASPAGDTLPILLATGAEIVLGSARGERTVAAGDVLDRIPEDGPRRRRARAPRAHPAASDREVRFRKIGTRRAQAISKVVMALAWRPGEGAALDGCPAGAGLRRRHPVRAAHAEAVLEGAAPDRATADLAAEALAGEIHPIDDVRSTADYRRAVASRVLHRLIRDEGGW